MRFGARNCTAHVAHHAFRAGGMVIRLGVLQAVSSPRPTCQLADLATKERAALWLRLLHHSQAPSTHAHCVFFPSSVICRRCAGVHHV